MKPVFSIITVVFNGEDYLEDTILSVLNQTYPHIEYIIIDGNSKDDTSNILQRYADHLAYWVSEPDKGLYDAMNKGIQAATGDFLWFMNAGDHIHAKNTVEKMAACCTENTDVLYGEVMMVDEERKPHGHRSDKTLQKLPDTLHWKSLSRGMVVSHQAFLPKRSIAPLYQLGNLSADIGWVIDCLKKSRANTHTHLVLADYLMGGLSKKRHRKSLWDRYDILKSKYGFLPNLWNHAFITIRSFRQKLFGKGEKY